MCTLGVLLLLPVGLVAQSTSSASISGSVRDAAGSPVSQALVTLSPMGSGATLEATTTASGSFTISGVRPGPYELRIEALGYRPLVAQGLTLAGGEERSVELNLRIEPPPVLSVDTIVLAASGATQIRGNAIQLGFNEIDQLPHRSDDLASIVSLSSAFDEALGATGLPGDMTRIVVDDVPFYRASHPTARSEAQPDALFTRSAVASASAISNPTDMEWAGTGGGQVSAATRSSAAGDLEFDGAYGGGPLWSSSELDIDTPSLLSYQTSLRSVVPLGSARTQLFFSGEALRHDTPLAPRVSETLTTSLSGLDAELLAALSEPSVESYSRYSGLIRVDHQGGDGRQGFFRAAAGFSERAFDRAGPTTFSPGAGLAEESFDLSIAGGLENELGRTLVFQLRGGFSGSFREFGGAVADRVPGYLADSGVRLGNLDGAGGESSRNDFLIMPIVRSIQTMGTWKFGGTMRISNHTMTYSRAPGGSFLYADPAALLSGQGALLSTITPEADFGTQEYSAFAQYELTGRPDLRLTIGGRYDFERIGGDGPAANQDWLTTAGIFNDSIPTSFHQFGAGGSLTWRPAGSPGTSVFLAGSIRDGDVDLRAIGSVIAQSTAATSTVFSGSSLDWPSGNIPPAASDLPLLTLLGPDTRAPRTLNVSVGLTQRVGSSLTVSVSGSTRRSDFLTRRRNLNMPIAAQAADPDGRAIYGTLQQDGSLVTATGADARRFASFGDVWALDPDGWSEYRGGTIGLEHTGPNVDLFGSYTYSETTDNWLGARSGSIDATLDPGLPTGTDDTPWSESTSDFDLPHRAAAGATLRFGAASLSGVYHFRSGYPFTPRYRMGVDANGDGSFGNDVAFIPAAGQLGSLASEWSCLEDNAARFAPRNACRGPERHSIDVRLQVQLADLGGRTASLTIDGFNLIEGKSGLIDDALFLVDPTGSITTSPDGSTVTIPFIVNDRFGESIYPDSRGRMVRIGVRIGG